MSGYRTTTEEPRAWVGCLACYNDGRLVGEWVDGSEAGDCVPCRRFGHEEWWVFDHEGYAGTLTGECSPVEAQRVAETLEALPDYVDRGAFAAWVSECGGDLDGVDGFEESYRGAWDDLGAFALELFEDTSPSSEVRGLVDSWPFTCLDWDRAGRELVMGGDVHTVDNPDGGIWVFWS